MDEKYKIVYAKIDDKILSDRLNFEITTILLMDVFINWSTGEKSVRKFLLDDLYHILEYNKEQYLLDLDDYSKNAELHYEIQKKLKKTKELIVWSQNKQFHDDILYLMNILS